MVPPRRRDRQRAPVAPGVLSGRLDRGMAMGVNSYSPATTMRRGRRPLRFQARRARRGTTLVADGFVKSRSWADDGEVGPSGDVPDAGVTPPESAADGNQTADERAQFVVKRLEQFIREGRTIAQGMSFRQWQAMARIEISNAIIAAENSRQDDDVVTKRLLFMAAAALVTIGFWGTLLAFDKAAYLPVAIICGGAGFCLFAVAGEWRIRKSVKARRARRRSETVARVEGLTRRIKRMEKQLEQEAKALEKAIEKTAQAQRDARRKQLGL